MPLLQSKRDQSFPDPSAFTNEADFNYAAKVTAIYKKVIQELLVEIEKYKETATFLRKKEDGELEDPFGIGRGAT